MTDIDRTATMTGDTAPSPNVVSASSEVFGAFQAFDKVLSQGWAGNRTAQWIKYDFGPGRSWICTGYSVTSDWNGGGFTPTSWTFQGSNNNSDWTTIDTQSGQTWGNTQTRHYAISNTQSYRYYQWVNLDGSGLYTELGELTIEAPVSVGSLMMGQL